MREYFHVINKVTDGTEEAAGWPRRACAPKPPRYIERQRSPTIFCLKKDPTSSKEMTYCKVWVDSREGSQGIFFSFAFTNWKREHFRQRLIFSMKLERLCFFPLDVCESWPQGLPGCEPEVSKSKALKCFALLQQCTRSE